MAAIINTVYPSYNNVSNYSGTNAAIKSAGAVSNVAHADAVIGLEREGRLGLSQFGLIKLPREVLFLQDERSAKVKITQQGDKVVSSNETDLDDERRLEKVDDATDDPKTPDALKGHKGKTSAHEKTPEAHNNLIQGKEAAREKAATDAAHNDTAQKQAAGREAHADKTTDPAFASLLARQAGESRNDTARTERKTDDSRKSRPSVVGAPINVYTTIHTSASKPTHNEEHQSLDVRA